MSANSLRENTFILNLAKVMDFSWTLSTDMQPLNYPLVYIKLIVRYFTKNIGFTHDLQWYIWVLPNELRILYPQTLEKYAPALLWYYHRTLHYSNNHALLLSRYYWVKWSVHLSYTSAFKIRNDWLRNLNEMLKT